MNSKPNALWAAVSSLGKSRRTVFDIMEENRGAGPGFDMLRIAASLLVILTHSFGLSYGTAPFLIQGPAGPLFSGLLPVFFGLSGFLVTGSALRTKNVKVFLSFRVLRIVPALMTEVTLSAVVLGTLMTTVPLAAYFSDPRFFVYFGNIVGWIHFHLPGVFESNPRPGIVNENLWTLHPELECYALMAGLMLVRLIYDRRATTILWLAITLVAAALNLLTGRYELHGAYPGEVLVYYFLTGIVAFHWREKFPVSAPLFVGSLVVAWILLRIPHTVFIVQFPIIYIMMFLGVCRFPRIEWLQRGDYSYGLYLYGFPVQQSLVALFPVLRQWWLLFPVSTAITLIVAMTSWHVVEKPALRLKRLVTSRPRPIPVTTEPPLTT